MTLVWLFRGERYCGSCFFLSVFMLEKNEVDVHVVMYPNVMGHVFDCLFCCMSIENTNVMVFIHSLIVVCFVCCCFGCCILHIA